MARSDTRSSSMTATFMNTVWNYSWRRKRGVPGSLLVRGLAGMVLLIQILIFFKATQVHTKDGIGTIDATQFLVGEGDEIGKSDATPFLLGPGRPMSKSKTIRNRILIGIISTAANHVAMTYRNRHRKLFALWNDTRVCSLHDFVQYENQRIDNSQYNGGDEGSPSPCQIIYTFVIGGNPNGTTLLLDHNETTPLTLPSMPRRPRHKDANLPDVTILNIQENMNHGKTPTFFYFALQVMRQFPNDIHYAMKCDSDAMLRLTSFLQFVDLELPILPNIAATSASINDPLLSPPPMSAPAVLIGSLRHKSLWEVKGTPELRRQFEGLWDAEYYNGVHLYLAGQCYALSTRAVELLVDETRRQPLPLLGVNFSLTPDYYEGHEDHDTSSSVIVAATRENVTLRWIDMARHYRFWEHPVKGDFWWNKILARETKKIEKLKSAMANQTDSYSSSFTSQAVATPIVGGGVTRPQRKLSTPRLLLFLIDSIDPKVRKEHRQALQKDKRVCALQNFLQQGRGTGNTDIPNATSCEIVYTFVMGGNPKGPRQIVHKDPSLELIIPQATSVAQVENDLLVLNIRDNLNGIVPTILYYVTEHLTEGSRTENDFVMIAEARKIHPLDLNGWVRIRDVQLTPVHHPNHHVLVGQIRDTWQQPWEFPIRNESFFHLNFDSIHLYLASNCYALSMAAVKGVVRQVQEHEEHPSLVGRYLQKNNHGHDISTFAFFIPKLVLHLVSVTKSQQFWTTRR